MCSADASGTCSGGGGKDTSTGNYFNYSDSYWDAGWDSQLFTFKIGQAPANVSNLSVTWRGHGDPYAGLTRYTDICIWNNTSQTWALLNYIPAMGGDVIPGCHVNSTFVNYSAPIATNPAYYIDSTGKVSILAMTSRDAYIDTGIYTDYIVLTVH
jgi:hypothetical protein